MPKASKGEGDHLRETRATQVFGICLLYLTTTWFPPYDVDNTVIALAMSRAVLWLMAYQRQHALRLVWAPPRFRLVLVVWMRWNARQGKGNKHTHIPLMWRCTSFFFISANMVQAVKSCLLTCTLLPLRRYWSSSSLILWRFAFASALCRSNVSWYLLLHSTHELSHPRGCSTPASFRRRRFARRHSHSSFFGLMYCSSVIICISPLRRALNPFTCISPWRRAPLQVVQKFLQQYFLTASIRAGYSRAGIRRASRRPAFSSTPSNVVKPFAIWSRLNFSLQ